MNLIHHITHRLQTINQSRGIREGWDEKRNDNLFSGSPFAYVAYETALRLNKSHRSFTGKIAFRRKFRDFQSQSRGSQKRIIRQWGEALRNEPSISRKIETWVGAHDQTRPSPPVAETPEPEQPVNRNAGGYSLRPRRSAASRNVPENNTLRVEPGSEASSSGSRLSSIPPPEGSHSSLNDDEPRLKPTERTIVNDENGHAKRIYADFPMQAVKEVLPAMLVDSLRRKPHPGDADVIVPALHMVFYLDDFGNEQGMMGIEIARRAVGRYARRLFGAEVEEREPFRHIYLPNSLAGVRGIPDLQLFHCPRDILDTEFGPEIGNAIRKSVQYRREGREREIRTDTVRMTIPNEIIISCVITLQMGSDEAKSILNKLYEGDPEEEESGEGEE